MSRLVADGSRRQGHRIGVLVCWTHTRDEGDVELTRHVDGQVAQVHVDPVTRTLDLGEGVEETRKSLEDAVEAMLVRRPPPTDPGCLD
jgi:hypothetical protein